MADPLVEAFATPPTVPERWQRGIAGAIVGTRAGARKVMEEIAADDWAISPYRRWLAGLVGGKAGDYNIKLDEAEKEYIELDNKYKQLKEAKRTGKISVTTEKKGKSEKKMTEDLEAKLNDKQIELIRSLGGNPDNVKGVPREIEWAGVLKQAGISEKHKTLNAKLGRLSTVPTIIKEEPIPVTEDEIEEADSLMSTARSKYKKLLRGFNEAISKKTDLEKMVRLRFQIDPRRRYGQREDTTEFRRRRDMAGRISESIEFLEKNYGDVKVKTETEEREKTEVAITRLLPAIKELTSKILDNRRFSPFQADGFARQAYDAVAGLMDITVTPEVKGRFGGNILRSIGIYRPLPKAKIFVEEIPYEDIKKLYNYEPFSPLEGKVKALQERAKARTKAE